MDDGSDFGIWPPYEAFYVQAMLFNTRSAPPIDSADPRLSYGLARRNRHAGGRVPCDSRQCVPGTDRFAPTAIDQTPCGLGERINIRAPCA